MDQIGPIRRELRVTQIEELSENESLTTGFAEIQQFHELL